MSTDPINTIKFLHDGAQLPCAKWRLNHAMRPAAWQMAIDPLGEFMVGNIASKSRPEKCSHACAAWPKMMR